MFEFVRRRAPAPPQPDPAGEVRAFQSIDWDRQSELTHQMFLDLEQRADAFATHAIPVVERTLFYDITDLILYLWTYGSVTEFQGVQVRLLAATLEGAPCGEAFDAVEFCFAEFARPWRAPTENLRELLAYVRSGRTDVDEARHMLVRLRGASRTFAPGQGSVYFVAGAFWAGGVTDGLSAVVRGQGGRFGVLIHNMLPITRRDFTDAATIALFEGALRQGSVEWDFISTISQDAAAEVEAYFQQASPDRVVPVLPIPLAHAPSLLIEDFDWEWRAELTLAAFIGQDEDERAFQTRAVPVVARGLFIDISDLLIFLWTHGFVTGIQRVQLELLAATLGETSSTDDFDLIAFCVSQFDRPWRLPSDLLRGVLDYAQLGQVDIEAARLAVDRVQSQGRAFLPGEGSVYFAPGAFWAGCVAQGLSDTVQRSGARFGVTVHDLFPITLPQMSEENTARSFEGLLRRGAARWDFFTTDSRYTAKALRAYVGRAAPGREVPIITVPLAHANMRGEASAELPAGLKPQAYILCVATIEPRKNHAVLIEAWRTLRARYPDTPDLVLVGRPGWRSEALVETLRQSRAQDGGLVWLDSVSDAELQALYAHCLFTAYPSLAEGWGLPVGESLAAGKVCVTSRRTSLPEVGGAFVVYVDPDSVRAMTRALGRLIRQPAYRLRWEKKIARKFKARTWKDVADDTLAVLSRLSRPDRQKRRGFLDFLSGGAR